MSIGGTPFINFLSAPQTTQSNQYTTMAFGEEGGLDIITPQPPTYTTMAVGEEGGTMPPQPPQPPVPPQNPNNQMFFMLLQMMMNIISTLMRLFSNPQPQPPVTTMALGEEGGGMPQPETFYPPINKPFYGPNPQVPPGTFLL